eukprot:scaffold1809_cov228-Pinguiococcus_pyrenoidosus.AAC.25
MVVQDAVDVLLRLLQDMEVQSYAMLLERRQELHLRSRHARPSGMLSRAIGNAQRLPSRAPVHLVLDEAIPQGSDQIVDVLDDRPPLLVRDVQLVGRVLCDESMDEPDHAFVNLPLRRGQRSGARRLFVLWLGWRDTILRLGFLAEQAAKVVHLQPEHQVLLGEVQAARSCCRSRAVGDSPPARRWWRCGDARRPPLSRRCRTRETRRRHPRAHAAVGRPRTPPAPRTAPRQARPRPPALFASSSASILVRRSSAPSSPSAPRHPESVASTGPPRLSCSAALREPPGIAEASATAGAGARLPVR